MKTLTSSAGKVILGEMFKTGESPEVIADRMNLWQNVKVEDILAIGRLVVWTNQDLSNQYVCGKEKVLNVLLQKALKESNYTMDEENLVYSLKLALRKYASLTKEIRNDNKSN